MNDRPEELPQNDERKAGESDAAHAARALREATGRARSGLEPDDGARFVEAREAHPKGGTMPEKGHAHESGRAGIGAELRDHADLRMARGETDRMRRDDTIEAGDAERRRAGELRRDPEDFRRQWSRASEAARREADTREYEWRSRGVRSERVSGIDRGEYAGTWDSQKSHKYTREQIEGSLRTLPEVHRRLDAGEKPEDLKALHGSADAREREIAQTYDSFYGTDAITIERDAQGRTRVLNGRHRLDSADQLGMDDLPMHVVEQVRREREGDR